MGLFGSRKKTYVGSTVYNMAGDELERMNYMKTTVIGGVLGEDSHKNNLGETIVNAHLNGPGIDQRLFFRWARSNFPLGMPTASINEAYNVNAAIVAGQIAAPSGENTVVQSAFIDLADFSFWAEQYIRANHPTLVETEWTADIDVPNSEIIIQYEDASTETIPLVNFDPDKNYLVAYYYFATPSSVQSLVIGSDVAGEPDLTDYTLDSDTVTGTPSVSLDTTVEVLTEYTNGDPDDYTTNTTTSSETFSEEERVYSKNTYEGLDLSTGGTINRDWTLYRFRDYEIVDVVTVDVDTSDSAETVTTTTTTQTLQEVITHREDQQDTLNNAPTTAAAQIYLYEIGSGNVALDALVSADNAALQEFFPFLPVRIKNDAVDETNFPTEYPLVKKAFRKAMQKNGYDKLLADIEDNDDIDEVDFCFITWGVSVNVLENAARKYIYDFFKELMNQQTYSLTEYNNWQTYKNVVQTQQIDYNDWIYGQLDPSNPLYQAPEPPIPEFVEPNTTTLRLKSALTSSAAKHYDMRLSWITIGEEIFAGTGQAGAKTGDTWFEVLPDDTYQSLTGTGVEGGDGFPSLFFGDNNINKCKLYLQESGSYRVLTIVGMKHSNYVYDGKSVDITLKEGLEDGEESGFIVPMHYPTVKAMSLVDSTQMVTANTFLIFNSYQVVKKKWWQTGIFKIFLVIVIAVVTVVFAPAGATLGGILGTHAAVGGALGLTGMTAVIAGAVVNALAAMVLMQIIEVGATAVFGEKIGAIISTIVGFIVMNQGMFFENGALSIDWGQLMRADNLLRMTQAISSAAQKWIAADIAEIQAEMEAATEEYEDEMSRIKRLYYETFGLQGGVIDPMMFTDTKNDDTDFSETLDVFLTRTLLTGSDVAQLSLDMVSDFTEATLELPKFTG